MRVSVLDPFVSIIGRDIVSSPPNEFCLEDVESSQFVRVLVRRYPKQSIDKITRRFPPTGRPLIQY